MILKRGIGGVDHARGEMFNPIIFAFAREALAAPVLYVAGYRLSRRALPAREDALASAGLGFFLFLSQLMFIAGIELSGVVLATCIQPVIPVLTALLSIVLGAETARPAKLVGIALSVAGAICMVAGGASGSQPVEGKSAHAAALGKVCLALNVVGMASYYVIGKRIVSRYHAVSVASWAYAGAAALMGLTAVVFTDRDAWHVPRSLRWPLAYWVLVCSVGGYALVTTAMQHLPASQVAAFQCLQPFLGTALAAAVLGERPSAWDLGAIGVVAGLVVVSRDKDDGPGAPIAAKGKGGGAQATSAAAAAAAGQAAAGQAAAGGAGGGVAARLLSAVGAQSSAPSVTHHSAVAHPAPGHLGSMDVATATTTAMAQPSPLIRSMQPPRRPNSSMGRSSDSLGHLGADGALADAAELGRSRKGSLAPNGLPSEIELLKAKRAGSVASSGMAEIGRAAAAAAANAASAAVSAFASALDGKGSPPDTRGRGIGDLTAKGRFQRSRSASALSMAR